MLLVDKKLSEGKEGRSWQEGGTEWMVQES